MGGAGKDRIERVGTRGLQGQHVSVVLHCLSYFCMVTLDLRECCWQLVLTRRGMDLSIKNCSSQGFEFSVPIEEVAA